MNQIAKPRRLTSLDGLRGFAAVGVVLYHSLIASNLQPILNSNPWQTTRVGSLEWWLLDTPLKFFTSGTEAVIVFFVLSGFVLTLPIVKLATYDWIGYMVRRFLRIWLPAVASIALAGFIVAITNQTSRDMASRWLRRESIPHLDWEHLWGAIDLFWGPTHINNPLWTLKWELLFSFTLPIFVALAALLSKIGTWPAIVLCVVASAFGLGYNVDAAHYLPAFLAGVLLAFSYLRKQAAAPSPAPVFPYRTRSATFWSIVLVIGGILVSQVWNLARTFLHMSNLSPEWQPLQSGFILGAAMIVWGAIISRPFAAILETRLAQWLGRISFSLYLVHAPIIIGMAHIFGVRRVATSLLVSLPLSFVVASFFSRWIEWPSQIIARAAGNHASSATAKALALNTAPPASEPAPARRQSDEDAWARETAQLQPADRP